MGPQVVDDDHGEAAASTRPSDSGPDLGAQDLGRAAWGQAACKPAVAPVDEPKAIDYGSGSGRLDQALSAAAFATPDPGQGRMKRQLDLVLEIDIGVRQERQQLGNIGRHCSEPTGLAKRHDGWREWRASPGQDHLHPEAFPTEPGCASAVHLRGHVGRWQP
jgi:hypothetical protein